MRNSLFIVVAAAVVSPLAVAQSLETPGKLDAVTVYRGQALVTRLVALTGPAGLREVVVTQLPEHVVPGSIHAETTDGVEVRSVSYRARPVEQDVREEVRKLDEQIRAAQDRLAASQRRSQLVTERKAYLDKLEQFTAASANVELTRGVLNAETLEKISMFMFNERGGLAEEELKLGLEQRGLQEQLALLDRQRQTLTAGSARTLREAVIFVNLTDADGGQLRVRYLVNNANWSPSYNVRTDGTSGGATVEYNAAIEQLSGEDWSDVSMTLSTATPSLVAKAPVLAPLTVALAPLAPQAQAAVQSGAKGYSVMLGELSSKRLAVERDRAGNLFGQQRQAEGGLAAVDGSMVFHVQANDAFDKALNEVAGEIQLLDLVAAERPRLATADAASPPVAEGFSVTYRIAARTTLPSRTDRQLIQIASLPLKGTFYRVAVPVLTSYVYQEAELINDSSLVLLAGPVAAYVAGQFVGHGEIATIASGESFTVGLGIDSSLRVAREMIDKKETIQGGNRVVDLTYRLTLENFGAAPADVRLMDRLPATKGSEIRVTLGESSAPPLAQPGQVDADRKKGILRWDVQAAAQAAGAKALTVDYQFKLEYDKQMAVTGMAGTQ